VNDPRNDRDLRELFDEFRTEDRVKTPDFQPMMARVRADIEGDAGAQASEVVSIHSKQAERGWAGARSFRSHRWTWMGGVLAAAAIAAVMLVGQGSISDEGFEELVNAYANDPALGGWQSPTDALLELPGREIVTTIPRVGGTRTLLGVPEISGTR